MSFWLEQNIRIKSSLHVCYCMCIDISIDQMLFSIWPVLVFCKDHNNSLLACFRIFYIFLLMRVCHFRTVPILLCFWKTFCALICQNILMNILYFVYMDCLGKMCQTKQPLVLFLNRRLRLNMTEVYAVSNKTIPMSYKLKHGKKQ